MNKSFRIPLPVIYLNQKLREAGYESFVVGGAVRDLMLGKENITDWDVTTNAKPEKVLELFNESFCDNKFGTVMVAAKHVLDQFGKNINLEEAVEVFESMEVFDVTTYRSESGYSNSRHPDNVEWGESLSEDVKRRDFTINALALKLPEEFKANGGDYWLETEAEVIDFEGGLEDLEQKLVRSVGPADKRFGEDALRMMRAIRIAAQLGFSIEHETQVALKDNSKLLEKISQERIRDELFKTLASNYPADGILLMTSSGLLDFVLPELIESQGVPQGGHHIYDVWKHNIESLRECPSKDPLVRLATLLHDVGKPRTMKKQGPRGVTFYGHEVVGAHMCNKIADRLKLSKKQKIKLFTLVRWHMFHYQPEMTDSAIRRFIRRVGRENIADMMMLRVGDRKGGGSKTTSWRLQEFQKRIGENLYEPMSVSDLAVSGHDVMTLLDIKPSRLIGEVLNALFEDVMEGKLENKKEILEKEVVRVAEQVKQS